MLNSHLAVGEELWFTKIHYNDNHYQSLATCGLILCFFLNFVVIKSLKIIIKDISGTKINGSHYYSQGIQSYSRTIRHFVIELVSPSDLKNQRYEDLQAKMQEYLDNGVRLGWLIEPSAKMVEIYRVGQQVEILNSPQTLSGEDVLPGFVLDLSEIF